MISSGVARASASWTPYRHPPCSSAEPFLAPRVGVVVVAASLPESGAVFGHELDRARPLGALPEVTARHHESHGIAVVRLERRAIGPVGENRVRIEQCGERQ